jgi:DNA-binding CsgD family transcriptional regulator/tetratricopeptide (TPR) repeat protein
LGAATSPLISPLETRCYCESIGSETGLVAQEAELLERSEQLTTLAEIFATVVETGRGRMALVSGDAGIGKTSLVQRFCDRAVGSGRALWGTCDVLFTPRPLGPLLDIAEATGGDLAEAVQREAVPYEVAAAVGGLLEQRPATVLVLEDVHAADEATLDVVRLLARRVDGLPALVIVTYRDVGLDRWHPLRVVLGEIAAGSHIDRLRLAPLSREAVADLATPHGAAADELYLKTAGNPFFVTEALAAEGEEIPATVRDAVLGRSARLSPGARALLDAIAVAGSEAELWLLDALASDSARDLEECIASGIVVTRTRAVAFSHQLARRAIEESIPVQRALALHRAALTALESPPEGAPDPARLAHHAHAAGDAEAVLKFAPLAAAKASRLGAHRESAIHYGQALGFAELLPLDARAMLFSGRAQELFLTLGFDEAVAALEAGLRCYEELGDHTSQAAALTFLAQLRWLVGSLPEALATAQEALDLLEGSPGPDLVSAYMMMAVLLLAAEDPAAAMTWARRVEALAEQLEDSRGRIQALQIVGWVEYFTATPGGVDKLAQARELARETGLEDAVAMTYVIVVRTAGRFRDFEIAAPWVSDGLDYCSTRDFDVWRYYLLSWQSKVLLAHGRWTEAAQTALVCLGEECPFARIHALVALGLVRARRGDPDAWGPLDEAVTLAEPRREQQWIAPVAIARAEAAWLEGRNEAAIAETELAYDDARRLDTSYVAGLSYWRWRAGADEPTPHVGEEPYRLEMQGDWAGASQRWKEMGCPYEAALALLDADDEDTLHRALGELQALGAQAAAGILARRLRKRGALNVPRGQRATTRANPANLTPRELEVLNLLAEGLHNAEIAERLFVAEKTVAHHVSAILRKLGVPNRVQAVTEAARLGIDGQQK